jgi:hypothetical protein
MPVQIEINEAHIDAIIDFYIQRLKALRDEITEKEREFKEINSQILKLKRSKASTPISANSYRVTSTSAANYSDKWPWVKKIQFAIEQQGKALTTKEIVDTLLEYEIGLMFDRRKAVASISSVLSVKSGADKEFLREESDSGEFAYSINNPIASENDDEDVNPFDS